MALKPLIWVGRCREDLKSFPEDVRMAMGYALHAFQKKSRKGVATARRDLELVKQRLRWAEQIHPGTGAGRGSEREEEA